MATPDWIKHVREKCGHDLLMAVGVCAVIVDQDRRVLLQRRTDNHQWTIPGGFVDPGESIIDAILREVKEETGLDVSIVRVSGIYSKRPVTVYPNGDQINDTVIAFLCVPTSQNILIDPDETNDLHFFPLNELPTDILDWCTQRITDATQRNELTVI